MKRTILLAVSLSVAVGAFADSSMFSRWNWPLVSEWQSYETGSQGTKEGTVGGVAWPSTKPLADPYQSARYGTLNQGQPAATIPDDSLQPAADGTLGEDQVGATTATAKAKG